MLTTPTNTCLTGWGAPYPGTGAAAIRGQMWQMRQLAGGLPLCTRSPLLSIHLACFHRCPRATAPNLPGASLVYITHHTHTHTRTHTHLTHHHTLIALKPHTSLVVTPLNLMWNGLIKHQAGKHSHRCNSELLGWKIAAYKLLSFDLSTFKLYLLKRLATSPSAATALWHCWLRKGLRERGTGSW